MSTKMSLREWLHEKLSKILSFEVPREMVGYIVSMESERDLQDYCHSLLNFSNAEHRLFYQELLQRRQENSATSSSAATKPLGYMKPQQQEIYFVGNMEKKAKGKKDNSKSVIPSSTSSKSSIPSQESSEATSDENLSKSSKKRPKYVNLYSQEGMNRDVVLLKGRHLCNCQAAKHKLVNNCVKCGRIVCEQEGAGPCLFCGNLVCSPDEMKVLQRNSRQSEQLLRKLMNQAKPSSLEAAVAQRNRLLEYDRTSERRTKVIDDESDYYSSNSVWLSDAERERLKKQEEMDRSRRHASRRDARFTLDFAGRQVVEEAHKVDVFYDDDDNASVLKEIQASANINADPGIDFPELKFDGTVVNDSSWVKTRCQNDLNFPQYNRIQDREFLEMSDSGCCLSMHQPWASLLISGIKLHEGRNWYTAHRGRLWIAAAAKEPDLEDIKMVESAILSLRSDQSLHFPEYYPTGCLLGCVTVVDCLAQEEYREKYPLGESDSPFVFICEDPVALSVRFPMQGRHKIYQLDSKIHAAAQKSIQRMAKIQAEKAHEFAS